MDANLGQRLQARVFREMQANRDNPFNSPPSSTGSHGTVSPTTTSFFLSEPDAESTRRLNDQVNRHSGINKLKVNWDAIHRKWPEHYSKPLPTLFGGDIHSRPKSANSKENSKPAPTTFSKFIQEDSTREVWQDCKRKRAEMQARVDDESDSSVAFSKSPAALLSNNRHLSPISRGQAQTSLPVHDRPPVESSATPRGRHSTSDVINRPTKTSTSPQHAASKHMSGTNSSPNMSSAKSSFTAVPPSPSMGLTTSATSNVRSFFVPDVTHLSHLLDCIDRKLQSSSGSVPIIVKQGKVIDRQAIPAVVKHHTTVDAVEVPDPEEEIFVSMDMIRNEIISLLQHYEEVQAYAANLQQENDRLKSQPQASLHNQDKGHGYGQAAQENSRLHAQVITLKTQLDQTMQQLSTIQIEKDSLLNEKDRVFTKLQEACDDINKLTRKLTVKEKALETSQKQLDTTEQLHHDNDTLRRDVITLSRSRDALKLEIASVREENEKLEGELQSLQSDTDSLCAENQQLRQQSLSLIAEIKSLCSNNAKADHSNVLNQNITDMQHELDTVRQEMEKLQKQNESAKEELDSLRQDNKSLVRQNETLFIENKTLQREVTGFERSVRDLHENNFKLKGEIVQLKKQAHQHRSTSKADIEQTDNMTSGFFMPDITLNTNVSTPAEADETKDMSDYPDVTAQSQNPTAKSQNMTAKSQNMNAKNYNTTAQSQNMTAKSQDMTARSRTVAGQSQNIMDADYTESVANTIHSTNSFQKKSHSSEHQGQKVAFSVPAKSGVLKTAANQGSKRQSASRSSTRLPPKARFEEFSDFDETTEPLSLDIGATQDQVMELSLPLEGIFKPVDNREQTPHPRKTKNMQHTTENDITVDSTKNFTSGSIKNITTRSNNRSVRHENSNALSSEARRVLDGLCEHNCNNCIVCTRITSHRATNAELAAGKKRVTVPRPVPVTDRELTVEDPTMRPFQSPGHALAVVIKGLEDESRHLQRELTQLQAKYNRRDKATGRKDRAALAGMIRSLLKTLEGKNDQIYSLYDVLEGQKAAGQAMSEEELEMTVLNITGLSVHDLTDQLTWEGCQ